ncbi:MAG TPA: FtsX-like permease family protein, partial [Acidimicrobiales bacterium]
WLPDDVAAAIGAQAGDTVTVGVEGQTTSEHVVGVYPSLVNHGFDSYWCTLRGTLGTSTVFNDGIPPPLVITDEARAQGLAARFGLRQLAYRVEAPLAAIPRTLTEARAATARFDRVDAAIPSFSSTGGPASYTVPSRLRYVTNRAAAIRTSVAGAVMPMAIVSGLVALGLVCGVTGAWLDRRRTEVRLLWIRGVSPWLIGLKAVLEMFVPLVVGVAAGAGLALGLIRVLGPSPRFDAGATATAAWWALGALALAVAAIASTVVVRLRSGLERVGVRRRLPVPILWEIPVLLLAAWSLHRFNEKGLPTVEGATLPPVDVLSLLFPLLFLAGALGLAARLLRVVLSLTRRVGERWPISWYLAVRRLAHERGAVLVLAGLAAMAVGVVVYGNGLVRSTNATVAAKSGVSLGASSVAVRYGSGDGVPAALAGRATQIRLENNAIYGDGRLDLLVVDPSTFADGAYWDASLNRRSLSALLQELSTPTPDGSVPAIAVNGQVPETAPISPSNRPQYTATIRVVDTIPVFPGVAPGSPMLVVAKDRLGAMEPILNRVVWTSASEDEVRRVAATDNRPIVYLVTSEQITDSSPALPIVWTFSFVQALGVLVGVLAIVALVAYVDGRQRARSVATALLARMGLSARRHWRSLVAELASLAVVAVVLGAVFGWIAVTAVHAHLDPIPDRFPAPLLRFPLVAVVGVAALAAVTVLAGSALAQRAAADVNLGEALREDV